MSKRIGAVYNSVITDIDLNELTFAFLYGCNAISHISESAVLMENNLTQPKGVDIIFSLFNMTKIKLYLENKSWMLLSPVTTFGLYSENKLFLPLSPIRRNYSKININNGPEFKCGILKKPLVTKLCCSLDQL